MHWRLSVQTQTAIHSLTVAILSWVSQSVQAHLGDIASSVPEHHNKVSIMIKQVIILLLVEGTAFGLFKNTTSMKCNKESTIKWGMPVMIRLFDKHKFQAKKKRLFWESCFIKASEIPGQLLLAFLLQIPFIYTPLSYICYFFSDTAISELPALLWQNFPLTIYILPETIS